MALQAFPPYAVSFIELITLMYIIHDFNCTCTNTCNCHIHIHVPFYFPLPGNGTVSRAEWVETFQSQFGGTAEQATGIFTKLDKDNSGDISLAEVTELFADMDADGAFRLGFHTELYSTILRQLPSLVSPLFLDIRTFTKSFLETLLARQSQ